MARKSHRVSVRIYQDELPELHSGLNSREPGERSGYLRFVLIQYRILGTTTAHMGSIKPGLDVFIQSDMPGQVDKLLFEEDIEL